MPYFQPSIWIYPDPSASVSRAFPFRHEPSRVISQISSDSTTRTPGRAARTAANNVAAIRSAGAIR